ncbi:MULTISPECIES: hypothetical protein [unclassified Gilliamella]|uniref:hypothetical protein n=1 Tax=unclassified Gilliamella TaxID=2685620 RepID=UPI00080EBC72|nr:hypothetical protein [Gilliamella apicola]OCG35606.1 hypothetical protein A9G31_07770 [Gilliamella apicola]OCG39716.1 hypothetical protein A9G25_09940 [Gilliamella apicola]
MTIDSGGAYSIRGFNYQKAVIAQIAINNFNVDNFYIIVENQEDIVVFFSEKNFHLQVKGQTLSIKSLIKVPKNKNSILYKLLNKEEKVDYYKVVTLDTFSKKDIKDLSESSCNIFDDFVYDYSEKQKEEFLKCLQQENLFSGDEKKIQNELDKTKIVFSNFKNDLSQAELILLGYMTKKGITMDDYAGINALNELFTQIDLKSEQKASIHNKNVIESKKITSKELKNIFSLCSIITKIPELRINFLESLVEDELLSKKERRDIELKFYMLNSKLRDLRKDILARIANSDFYIKELESNGFSFIHSIYQKLSDNFQADIYAVLIDIVSEKFLERNK